MKAKWLVVLVMGLGLPLLSQATEVKQEVKTYACYYYSKNRVDPTNKNGKWFLEDAQPQQALTVIHKTPQGYTIDPGTVWADGLELTNPQMTQMDTYAGNDTAMIFKKNNDKGKAYFQVFTTNFPAKPDEKPAENPISLLTTLMGCAVTE